VILMISVILFVSLALLLVSLVVWPGQVGRMVRRVRFTYLIGRLTISSDDVDVRRTRFVAAILLFILIAGLVISLLVGHSASRPTFRTYNNGATPYAGASEAPLVGAVVPFRPVSGFKSNRSTPIYAYFENRAIRFRTYSWQWLANGNVLESGSGDVRPEDCYVILSPRQSGFPVGEHEVQFYDDMGRPLITVYFQIIADGSDAPEQSIDFQSMSLIGR